MSLDIRVILYVAADTLEQAEYTGDEQMTTSDNIMQSTLTAPQNTAKKRQKTDNCRIGFFCVPVFNLVSM